MTFTTSANLIGLAWDGTATSNNKLATMLAWRKMRLFMWLGNSLLKSVAIFGVRHSGFLFSFFDTKNTACRGYKPRLTQMGLFTC